MKRNRQLRAVMAYHDVTQGELASLIKVKRTSITNKINGDRDWKYFREIVPIVQFFNGISEGLDISPYGVEDIFPTSEGGTKE